MIPVDPLLSFSMWVERLDPDGLYDSQYILENLARFGLRASAAVEEHDGEQLLVVEVDGLSIEILISRAERCTAPGLRPAMELGEYAISAGALYTFLPRSYRLGPV